MKKFKAWLKDTSKKALIIKTLIVPVIIMPLIVLIVWNIQVEGEKTKQAALAKANISLLDQAYIVAASGITPVDWEPTEEDTQVGFVPVQALPSNFLVNEIETSIDAVGYSSVNELSGTVAVSVTEANNTVIFAGTLLQEQTNKVVALLDEKNISITVVNPSSINNVLATRRVGVLTSPYATKSITGSVANLPTSTQVDTTTVSELPSTVGSTSPYVQSMKSKARLVSTATTNSSSSSDSLIGTFLLMFALSTIAMFIVFYFIRRRALRQEEGSTDTPRGGKKIDGVRNRNEKKDPKSGNNEEIPETRFSDVAGCDEAIDEMSELVSFLKEPDRFTRVGAKPPRGALLVGPPGTGKTLLARAVAGEAGVPFYAVAGSDFVEMYVGVGAKRVRELFSKARKHEEGAIIFIDEIDAIGRKRSSAEATNSNTEAEGTLNALLVEMDGFAQNNIIVLAATNRDDILDAALTRPGRLDRKVQVPLPDRAGRERILEVHSRNKPLGADVDLNILARRTPGMSGAELEQLVNEACMTAAREGRDVVIPLDFDHAVATVAMGKARHSAIVTPHDRTVTAWHEGGHTVAAMVIEEADEPVSVSIIPRGPAGGVTWMAPGDDIFLTRRRAFARLVVAMGGRAAEEIYLDGEFTSGPHGDLSSATQTAMAMVTQYGMTDAGLMIKSDGLLSTGSKVTDETIHAVEGLLAEALEVAREVLRENRTLLENVVEALLENDTLSHAELIELRGGKKFEANMPVAPKSYRKEKVSSVEEEKLVVVPVERVRFSDEKPKRKRLLKLGKIEIYLPEKEDKRKKLF